MIFERPSSMHGLANVITIRGIQREKDCIARSTNIASQHGPIYCSSDNVLSDSLTCSHFSFESSNIVYLY